MARKKAPEDLSVEELRRLLVEKRRGARKDRLEYFRRTGRVLSISPGPSEAESDRAAPIVDTAEAAESSPEQVPVNPPFSAAGMRARQADSNRATSLPEGR